MIEIILQLSVSISVLTNVYSLYRLLKALKENDGLEQRILVLEWMMKDLTIRGMDYGTRISGLAENTEMAE
jgi:hypothetical protein